MEPDPTTPNPAAPLPSWANAEAEHRRLRFARAKQDRAGCPPADEGQIRGRRYADAAIAAQPFRLLSRRNRAGRDRSGGTRFAHEPRAGQELVRWRRARAAARSAGR